MILIAHRGLLNGPDKALENKPAQIESAIAEGFFVEVDVWRIDNKIMLGHDEPAYHVSHTFLDRIPVIAHAKNLEALTFMRDRGVHCFWHNEDSFTLTSRGWIWSYLDTPANGQTICVMPELHKTVPDLRSYHGICTDYPILMRDRV